jgi:alginate O-acetyltransferase complex protein AlgI
MLFNSVPFLIFFTVVTLLYFLLPHRYRWILLLGASCYFYMSFVPMYILILALTIGVDYVAALYIVKSEGKKRKFYLNLSIWTTIAILFVFKYFNFFNTNVEALAHALHWNYSIGALKLILPIGLSFHTFQSLSYVIEVYRGNQKPERHFGIYSLYVMYYPQLVAGPIERPQNLLHQFHEKHAFDADRVRSGLLRMLWGLFKKVVIADTLSEYVDMIYNHPGNSYGLSVILATIMFAYQIYCDFSGYSDIALGAAEVMGIRLMTNFNRPYASQNISEFWQRWHISLSTWFYDYFYNSFVVNKRHWGNIAMVLGLIITFLISGLWHGAGWTYVFWGFVHGTLLSILLLTMKFRRKLNKNLPKEPYRLFSIALTFIFVCFGYVFFRAASLHDAFLLIRHMFMKIDFHASPFGKQIETLADMVTMAFMLPILWFMEKKFGANPLFKISENKPMIVKWAVAWFGLFLVLGFGSFVNTHSFIYFQF